MSKFNHNLWERLSFLFPFFVIKHLNEFQNQNFIATRGEALRRLVRSGLLYENKSEHYHTDEEIPSIEEIENFIKNRGK